MNEDFFMVNRPSKQRVEVSPLIKGIDVNLAKNKENQPQRIKKKENSSIKSINNKVLSLFHQNIRGLR
jgi:hypothetical protein